MKGSLKPKRKVAAGGLAGAISALVVWIMEANGINVPGQVGTAIGTIVSFGVAYLVPSPVGEAP